ncbi:tRNA methyltransferase [Candidatus Woesearchaeota archaeon]|nr:tRNA methyltransferase [Candidatus Woesearchaeota archaeon]|tara:strand:- start:23219 stop:24172 length:954 start_codon:yes stop_codon:yes gene_type:complete
MNLEPIPEAEKVSAKPEFEKRYKTLLGGSYDEFMKYSLSYITKGIRVNTLKTSIADVKKRLEQQKFTLKQIPWCKEGFWVKGERTDLGNLIEHFLGYIYIQEAASMLPATVLQPKPGEIVLDMCGSPGSKTTQMASLMQNKGLIVVNDISGARMKPLGLNLQRNGILNTVVTIMYGQQFGRKNILFDKVLVDAPCSGTGTIRRSPDTLKMWNSGMIKRLSRTQKSLIEAGFNALKSGGTLVYSTCSVEPEENEEVIDYLLNKFSNASLEKIDLDIKKSNPILKFENKTYSDEIKKCLRIWPQDNNTEGFFVAKIRKR